MKKIVLITVLAILIGSSSVVAIKFAKQKTSNSVVYEKIPKNEQKIEDNIVPEIVEESVVEDEKVVEVHEETTKQKQKNEDVVVQKETKNNSTSKSEKTEKLPEETKSNENKQQRKKQNDTKSDIEEKQEDNTPVIEETTQDVIVEQEKKPEVDEEYERLMKQVEYATYEECLQAGFDIALTDTVNILGFDPVEIIYKGEVIGYKLKIHYTNPMEN